MYAYVYICIYDIHIHVYVYIYDYINKEKADKYLVGSLLRRFCQGSH